MKKKAKKSTFFFDFILSVSENVIPLHPQLSPVLKSIGRIAFA